MWSGACRGLYAYGYNGWQSLGLMLLHLAVFIGVIYLITRLLIPKSNREDQVISTLKEEYARGKISKEEFIERRDILKRK